MRRLSTPLPFGSLARLLSALLLIGSLIGVAAAAPPPSVVLLYDGREPEQAALEAAAALAFAPHAAAVDFRTMHAGRSETVPFLRRHDLTRKHAPLLLVLSGSEPDARIARRIALQADAAPEENVRRMLAALRLKGGPSRPAPAPGTVVAAVTADGGEEERKSLVVLAGPQRQADGLRYLEPGSAVVYRLRLPEKLRTADLRGELGGSYAVEVGGSPEGPWKRLIDSSAYFSGLAATLSARTRPVIDLTTTLRDLAGALYVRVLPSGSVRDRAVLARLEVTALGPGVPSGETEWLLEVERLRKERLAALGPAGAATPLGGVQDNRTLTAARSPYLMTADVTVPWRKTLTIEPGVTIWVAGPFGFRIQGDLVARGTAERPITFAPAQPRHPDDWRGIEFFPFVEQPSGQHSALEYCRVTQAARVTLNRFAGMISRCRFEGCLDGVVLKDGGAGRLHHNRFTDCRVGLAIERGAGEVTASEWVRCHVALRVTEPHPEQPLRFEENSVVGSRVAAVDYPRHPSRQLPPLLLPNNYWGDAAAGRKVSDGPLAAEVRFEPLRAAPPAGAGPGW